MLCYAMLCYAMLCYALLCYVMQCCYVAMQCCYEHLAELLAEATPSDDNPYLARAVDLPDEPLPADEIEEKDLAEFCATIDGLTPACDKEQNG